MQVENLQELKVLKYQEDEVYESASPESSFIPQFSFSWALNCESGLPFYLKIKYSWTLIHSQGCKPYFIFVVNL